MHDVRAMLVTCLDHLRYRREKQENTTLLGASS